MTTAATPAQRKAEAARLERRLQEIDAEAKALEIERGESRKRLEQLRIQLTICPKCGRDRDFLTDEGGFLAHVLEDPEDTELLTAGKPLFCPACGDVFLYAAGNSPLASVAARASQPAKRGR